MAYELTMDGLFSYFDPQTIEKIIELPLVKRHLSSYDYLKCKEVLSLHKNDKDTVGQRSPGPLHVILSRNALKEASLEELEQYFNVAGIKAAYLFWYGEYFSVFELKMQESLAYSEFGFSASEPFTFPLLDAISEKKLLLHLQAAVALPLQAFTHSLMEQDFLLRDISALLTRQAQKAQTFITAIQTDDFRSKQIVISLAFSVLKVGLGAFNISELVNVSESLAGLASSSFDVMEDKLSDLVSDIQNLVLNTYFRVLEDAEKKLLSNPTPEDITLAWVLYRGYISDNATNSIKQILDSCVNNDNFFRCIIGKTLFEHDDLNEESLLIHAAEKAKAYVIEIVKGLQAQVNKVRFIRDAVLSSEGSEKIELYFRKICLINYTMSHENAGTIRHAWLTKTLGHRLSYYFPDVIFQKKWTSATLNNFFYDGVPYCKQKMSLEDYKARRQNSAVVLGLFRNSTKVREALFMNLEDQIPKLSDGLIKELQEQGRVECRDVTLVGDNYDTKRRRYCFARQHLSLFSFSEPHCDNEKKSIHSSGRDVVLVSRRNFDETKTY